MSGFARSSGFSPGRSSGFSLPGGFNPLSLDPALWMKETGLYQERTGASATTPASADADPIGTRLDYSSNVNHYTAPSDTTRPVLDLAAVNGLNAVLFDTVDDYLTGSAITLAGAFTLYAVGTRANATNWIPMGRTAGDGSALLIFSDSNVYANNSVGGSVSAVYTGGTGTILARFRRDVANAIKFAATGMAEVTLGTLASDIILDTHGARPASAQYNGSGNLHSELFLKAADIVTDDPAGNTSMLSYFQAKYGVTI